MYSLRKASMCVVVALGVAGCSSPGGDGGTPTAGGTLIMARTQDIDNLDPHVSTAFAGIETLGLVYDTLVDTDDQLNPAPGLAKSWDISNGASTITFHLREGVTFHNGDEFDSDDVKATMDRIFEEKTGAVALSNFASVKEVTTPDDSTVVFELSEPDVAVVSALASANAAIMSSDSIEKGDAARKPNGTGPFEFVEWKQGQQVSLEGFDDYWGEPPFLDAVEMRVVPEESSILSGLTAGQYHLGVLTDPEVTTQISEAQGLQVERTSSISYHVLQLNAGVSSMDDVRVRQAIACAVDPQQVVESAALGEGEVTGPMTIPAYRSEPTVGLPCEPPDVDKARQLLEDAGVADGFSLDTIVMTKGYATSVDEAQSLKAQLAEIGVDLRLELLENSVYIDRWLATKFDAAIALNGGTPDPHLMYARYFMPEGSLNSVAAYSSKKLVNLFNEGKAETDRPAREEIYEQLSTELVEASPWVWLFTGYEYRVLQEGVEGFKTPAGGGFEYLSQTKLPQ